MVRQAAILFCLAVAICSAHRRSDQPARALCGRSAKDSCFLVHESTEGPYYSELGMIRRNITEGKPGLPLQLRFQVKDITTCEPIPGAALEVWHCDALGLYSAYQVEGNEGGTDTTFLRGIQFADEDGFVTFDTIFPGWYSGRDIHIHVKVHLGGKVDSEGKFVGGHVSHIGQTFFTDRLGDKVAVLEPYVDNPQRRIFNNQDHWYHVAGEQAATMSYTLNRRHDISHGLKASMTFGVNTTYLSTGWTYPHGKPVPSRTHNKPENLEVAMAAESAASASIDFKKVALPSITVIGVLTALIVSATVVVRVVRKRRAQKTIAEHPFVM